MEVSCDFIEGIKDAKRRVMIKIEKISELYWEGSIGTKVVCEFRYFKDFEGKIWVNNITTYEDFQGKGYGTQMIVNALLEYQEIYISTAEKIDIKERNLANDERYFNEYCLEESNIYKFANRLIKKGILKSCWLRHPFKTC